MGARFTPCCLAAALAVYFGAAPLSARAQNAPNATRRGSTKCVRPESRPTPNASSSNAPDLTRQPTLYVVGYAHLDTEWRWEYPQTITEFLPKTLHDNFALFEKYPAYLFNFSGANRYKMIQEYYPADFRKLKEYVAAGRWFPAGASMEEGDVNAPSAEAILRQILYGNRYFQREFGKTSAEFMLPDSFGFPASLPSILAHAGIKGFSTQKLTWGCGAPVGGPDSPEHTPVGTPFNIGIWQGPDGNGVLAALSPGAYNGQVLEDLSNSRKWIDRVQLDGKVSGLFADYHYYGTGDTGGSPRESSVRNVQQSVMSNGPLHVVSATAEQMFLDIKPEQTARLPRYMGDLELTNHSVGSFTSQTYQKRWNRTNERLADAAEKASVAAAWLGGRPYPQKRLNDAWTLVMAGHFHDILAGTATPKAYEFAWNNDVLAMNQFAGVLTSAVEAVAAGLDTRAHGTPVVVYNPLSIPREDVVEAEVPLFQRPAGAELSVMGPDGRAVPAQLESWHNGVGKVLFLARVPSVGFAVYDVGATAPAPVGTPLMVTESSLENARYRIRVGDNGDVAAIYDKKLRRDLLSAPLRLAFQTERPSQNPAWNMDWEDQQKPPRGYVDGPAQVRITENGPVRVALTVERTVGESRFVQTIRLSAGDAGNRVEFGNVIDWQMGDTALKATFSLTAANPEATYNWDVCTLKRANNSKKQFEVPSHQWFDLTDLSGAYGVTVLTDCKNGSDKPDDSTLRLTLLYSPGLSAGGRAYSDQATQDWGHHEFVYGLVGHAGDWRREQSDWQALRLNQPLIAFTTTKHPAVQAESHGKAHPGSRITVAGGTLGRSLSLLQISSSRVRVMAVKRAEAGDAVIVRVVEADGEPKQGVRIAFAGPIVAAREVDGQERPIGEAVVTRGALVTSFTPYQIRSFAVTLAASPVKLAAPPTSRPVTLSYDLAAASRDQTQSVGGFDSDGRALPAEMLPEHLDYAGIRFDLAPAETGRPNAVTAHGQTIALPAGRSTRLYLLAAAANGDQTATLKVGDRSVDLTIQDWGGFIGQWDNRIWKRGPAPPMQEERSKTAVRMVAQEAQRPAPGSNSQVPARSQKPRMTTEFAGLKPGFIKPAPVAWFASHRHSATGANEPYHFAYLFAYALDIPKNATTLTLPVNDHIRILAITAADESPEVRPAQPLYDTLVRAER